MTPLNPPLLSTGQSDFCHKSSRHGRSPAKQENFVRLTQTERGYGHEATRSGPTVGQPREHVNNLRGGEERSRWFGDVFSGGVIYEIEVNQMEIVLLRWHNTL